MSEGTTATTPAARPSLPKAWLFIAKILFSFALFAFLFTRMPMADVIVTLRAVKPGMLAAAFGLLFLSNVLGAWQWWHLLDAVHIKIRLRRVLAYYHVGLFFNNFLPANIGGDIARVMDASRHGDSVPFHSKVELGNRQFLGGDCLCDLRHGRPWHDGWRNP